MAKKKIKKSSARDSKGRLKKKAKGPARNSKGQFKKKVRRLQPKKVRRPQPKKVHRPQPKKVRRPQPKKVRRPSGKIPGGKKYCSKIFRWFVMDIAEWHDKKARPVYIVARFEHSRSSPGATGKQRYSKVQNHLLGTFTKQKFTAWIKSDFGLEIIEGIIGDDGQVLGFVVKYTKEYLKRRGVKNPLRLEREKDMARLAKQAAKVAKRYEGKHK